MNIEKILLIGIIIYVFYLHNKINKNNREDFALSDTDKNEMITLIKPAIKEIYNTDMEAVRQLAAMATKLNAGGVEIPGNLTVTGNINSSGTFTGIGTVPIGSIIMWSGTIGTIPSNYKLCDGGNGTPDLRDKFVIGATQDMYNANSGNVWKAQTNITGTQTMTGGTKDAIVVSHNHGVTDPGHNHNFFGSYHDGTPAPKLFLANWEWGSTINVSTNTTGITIDSKGDSGTNQNLPPYYALAFIMRIS